MHDIDSGQRPAPRKSEDRPIPFLELCAVMSQAVIRKQPARVPAPASVSTHDGTRTRSPSGLESLPGGALNIAYEAVDRHVLRGHGEHVALRWLPREGAPREFTFEELRRRTNRFANALREGLGLARGDRIFVLCDRTPDLYVGVLGALKAGLVVCRLDPALEPQPVRARLETGQAKAVLTTKALFESKVEESVPALPLLHHVLVTGAPLEVLMGEASDEFEVEPAHPEDGSFLLFTALDLQPDDIFWCTAESGEITSIVAPLLHGVTSVVDEADFDAERCYRVIEEEEVSVLYAGRASIDMLMKAGPERALAHHFPKLRLVASACEPLDPEAVWWGRDVGLPIEDISREEPGVAGS